MGCPFGCFQEPCAHEVKKLKDRAKRKKPAVPTDKPGEWRHGTASDAKVLKLLRLHRKLRAAKKALTAFVDTLPDAHRLTYESISDEPVAGGYYLIHVKGRPDRELEVKQAAAQFVKVAKANPPKDGGK